MAMRPRQTIPRQWLIITDAADRETIARATRLPRGIGILLLEPLSGADMRKLRLRGATMVTEQRRSAVRVHNISELRRALLDRTPVILLSPIHATTSHPDWKPMPRMRAGALARLGGRRLIALGGMNPRKFARIRDLGFQGWAGITAFRI
jgi:thiamine-phosphate pyrophosphorylase